jgi:site-specific DNA-methyltransferase (adenine-specific)
VAREEGQRVGVDWWGVVKPFYEHGGITIYHGDCRDVLPDVWFGVDLLLTDPPYGVSEACNRKERGRSNLAECNDFPDVFDDHKPFDPSHLLVCRKAVLFGANHYADKLPPSPSWMVWDKRDGIASNDNADCELAWSNLGGPARVFRHLWSGMIKASERDQKRVHPTQKPVALMRWIIQQWTQPGQLVLDPYMGSGPTLIAAKESARRCIGIEIEERYCEIAAKRLSQEVLPLEAAV